MIEPSLNQYAPPVAEVADVAPASGMATLRLFSAKGRIGRLRYLAYITGASILCNILIMILGAGFAGTAAWILVTVVPTIILFWFNVITGIKRCHDLNISGWWSVTIIIPLIMLVWIFAPGSQAENRFGPPPPPNNWGVRLLGLILPVMFTIGVAAAVALPAYQAYVLKKAAETGPQS